MARPKNKKDLQRQGQGNYNKLIEYIEGLSVEEQSRDFPEGTLNRNIRDVLAHLHHWHLMMNEWYEVGMSGNKPEMPARGYTWKTTPQLNRWIWEKYSDSELDDIKSQFNTSYERIQSIIAQHSNEELFEKKRWKWTGSTSLGAYLISASSSHYEWALKLIKKAKK